MEHDLSLVMSIPWKLVKQSNPLISAIWNLSFLQCSASDELLQSARETEKTLSFKLSAELIRPAVLLHGVREMHLLSKPGARTLYHSFLANAWALKTK